MTYSRPRCNCPDATHTLEGNPSTRFPSRLTPSDWSNGFTGIREEGGYCIHELSVIRIRKELDDAFPNGIPADYPTEPAPKPEDDEFWAIPKIPPLPPIK